MALTILSKIRFQNVGSEADQLSMKINDPDWLNRLKNQVETELDYWPSLTTITIESSATASDLENERYITFAYDLSLIETTISNGLVQKHGREEMPLEDFLARVHSTFADTVESLVKDTLTLYIFTANLDLELDIYPGPQKD